MENRVEISNKQLINVPEGENSENDGGAISEKVTAKETLEEQCIHRRISEKNPNLVWNTKDKEKSMKVHGEKRQTSYI